MANDAPSPLLERIAIYCVPALAGLVTAAVLLGPGAERPAVGARIRGVLVEGSDHYALRVQTMAHFAGVYTSVPEKDLSLELKTGSTTARWIGATDDRGRAEASGAVKGSLGPSATITLKQQGALLAQGNASTAAPLTVLPERGALPPLPAGNMPISVLLPRGVAVADFRERVRVAVRIPESDAQSAPTISVKGTGAEIGDVGNPRAMPCDDGSCGFSWELYVTPKAEVGELSISIKTASGNSSSWRGEIPVLLGKLWLDPEADEGTLRIGAAIPKDEAFVSLLGENGRIWGARVPMESDERGFSRGTVELPAIDTSHPLTAMLSSDDNELLETTVAWPVRADATMVERRSVMLLVDGMPAVVAAESERRSGARRPALGLIVAAALFELFFLWRRSAMARAKLTRHLEDASADEEPASRPDVEKIASNAPLLWATIAAGALALAFAALAALTAFG